MAKLRICFDHFSEESIISYGVRRRLKDNAIPTLHLPHVELEIDNNMINNNLAQISENVQSNSNVMLITKSQECSYIQEIEEERINIQTIYTPNVRRLREKLRRYQKLLNKKKRAMIKLKKKKHENEWEDIMEKSSHLQSTFLNIIRRNYKSLPQVCC